MLLRDNAELIRRAGQRGDTVLAHINPSEAKLLGRKFGGDINPYTGLPQFGLGSSLKKIGKKIGGAVKSAVSGVGDFAGNIADWTKNIPGINAFTSQLALLDGGPSAVADIWKNNILPQYAMGAQGAMMFGGGQNPFATLGTIFNPSAPQIPGQAPSGSGLNVSSVFGSVLDALTGGSTSGGQSAAGAGGSGVQAALQNFLGGGKMGPVLASVLGGVLGYTQSDDIENKRITDLPEWQKPFVMQALQGAQQLYQTQQNTVAPLSAQTMQGLNGITGPNATKPYEDMQSFLQGTLNNRPQAADLSGVANDMRGLQAQTAAPVYNLGGVADTLRGAQAQSAGPAFDLTGTANSMRNLQAQSAGPAADISGVANQFRDLQAQTGGPASYQDELRAMAGSAQNLGSGQAGSYYSRVLGGDFLDGNPYLDAVINRAQDDVQSRVNSQFASGGRLNSGASARALAGELGDLSNQMRYTDYNAERGRMGEAAAGMAGLEQFGINAGSSILSGLGARTDAANQFNAGQQNAMTQFGMGAYGDLMSNQAARGDAMAQFNAGQANDMTQFGQGAFADLMAQYANSVNQNNQFNAGQANDMTQFGLGAYGDLMAQYANSVNQNNQFNAGQQNNMTQFGQGAYADLMANQAARTDAMSQFNQNYGLTAANQIAGMQDNILNTYGQQMNAGNVLDQYNQRVLDAPYIALQRYLQGVNGSYGGTTTAIQPQNQLLNTISGALGGYDIGQSLFKPTTQPIPQQQPYNFGGGSGINFGTNSYGGLFGNTL